MSSLKTKPNSQHGDEPKSSWLQVRVTQEQKARWVKQAQARGMKLSAWVCERLEDAGKLGTPKRCKVLKAALETVKTVLESDDPAIADTVWVPDSILPETLLDHVCAALESGKSANGQLSNRTKLASELERYNKWRRGAEDIEQPNPTELGILIDEVVKELRK